MNLRKPVLSSALLAVLSFATTLAATPITVLNHSFENPQTSSSEGDPAPDWQNNIGGIHKRTGTLATQIAATPDPADNEQMRWSNGGTFTYQVLTDPNGILMANTQYTLSVDIGARSNTGFSGAQVRLGTGSSMGDDLLTPFSSTTPTPASGNWALWTLVYITGAAPANLNQALRIELKSDGIQAQFDNVRLDFIPVPELGSAILLAMGCAALGLTTIRRRQTVRVEA